MIPTPFNFFNWGCRRLQLGQWRHREGNTAEGPKGCPPAERKAPKGTDSKGLPFHAKTYPHCHSILKGQVPEDKLDSDSCFH
jgi:hypothetical protein